MTRSTPVFGSQANYAQAMIDDYKAADVPTAAELRAYAAQGIRIWAPPM
jgi:hypothetical protein